MKPMKMIILYLNNISSRTVLFAYDSFHISLNKNRTIKTVCLCVKQRGANDMKGVGLSLIKLLFRRVTGWIEKDYE